MRQARRSVAVAACLAAALVVPPLGAQQTQRADPSLRYLLMTRGFGAEAPGGPLLRPDRPSGARAAALVPGLYTSAGVLRVRTLVRVGAGGEEALLRAGAEIGARAGDIVTARVPLDSVPALLAEPGIRAMEAAASLGPLGWSPPGRSGSRAPDLLSPDGAGALAANDSANRATGFDALRRRAGERWEGLAGQGVIIGVYDGGLDLDHPDFLRPDGSSRVLYAWHQRVEGPGPGAVGDQAFGYGIECTGPDIDAGRCPVTDSLGHGTHVTGTAAGDGSATGRGQPAWRFPGGAPAADLIVVKGDSANAFFRGDLVVDGVAYIFARAAALGRPAVVNISLSSQTGPHDGTTLLERALDALSGPGRIVVSGTGNVGDHRNTTPRVVNGPNHAQGRAGGRTQAVLVPEYAPRPGAVNDGALLELWYDGADSLAVTIRTPGGEEVTVATGDSATLFTPGGAVAVMNALDGPSPLNGDHAALIGILDAEADAPPEEGRWELVVTPRAVHAEGDYHLWLTGATFENEALPTRLEGGTTNRYLVGVPATADRVLAAGAYVTRHRWTSVQGDTVFPVREELGDIAFFSSPGPRRDGVSKPDVVAPGKVLVSSLSSDATLWDSVPVLVEADSVHVVLQGTSMAAPQLAATVALLLQIEPELTPEEARDLVRLSAASDAFAPGGTDPVWGAGKLDAAAAVERLRPTGIAGGEPVNLSENPIRDDGLVINHAERPTSIAVYTLVGERVRGFTDTEIGPVSTIWPLDTDDGHEVANGAYVLVVDLPGRRVVRKLLVARP